METKANEETHKKTMQGKKLLATVRQSEIYLRPLFKSLKQRVSTLFVSGDTKELIGIDIKQRYSGEFNGSRESHCYPELH